MKSKFKVGETVICTTDYRTVRRGWKGNVVRTYVDGIVRVKFDNSLEQTTVYEKDLVSAIGVNRYISRFPFNLPE